ncbi:MAG: alpha/beta fold hydrolase [Ectothiorhodospiraceae bacterium]|nr:alpha/beta fold hydrolase [Ectothiorhodospiraceae bacterium]
MNATLALHYQAHGEGEPLLILHGLFGSGSNWRRIARGLEPHRRSYLVDLRNHGQSPHDPVMTYPAMTKDVLRLLDHLGLERANLLGHSMGGKVAMWLALTHPERVQRLVVADIAPIPYPDDGDHGALIKALLALDLDRLRSRAEATERLADRIPSLGIRQFLLTNLEKHEGTWRWRIPLRYLRDSLDTIRGFPATDRRFPGPALFLHGGESPYVRDNAHPVIRDLFPGAEIVTMPGCGHWLHAEDPSGFSRQVADFLAQPAAAME